jgi:hypothetical protein
VNKNQNTIHLKSSKLKISKEIGYINSLRFQFQKISPTIKIKSLLLYPLKSGEEKLKISEKPKPTALYNKLKEKASNEIAQKSKGSASFPEKPSSKTKVEYEFISADFEDLTAQQERMQKCVETRPKLPDAHPYNTRNRHEEEQKQPINSYSSLLAGFVISCRISNLNTKDIVVELIAAAGGCYLAEEAEYCSLILVDDRPITRPLPSVPVLSLNWLYHTIKAREVLSFGPYTK